MGSRVRRGVASGPAEWLLIFLQSRDAPPRARIGVAASAAEWLLVFLDAASSDPWWTRTDRSADLPHPRPARDWAGAPEDAAEPDTVVLDRVAVRGA